jgi:hypothetical protein
VLCDLRFNEKITGPRNARPVDYLVIRGIIKFSDFKYPPVEHKSTDVHYFDVKSVHYLIIFTEE